MSIPDWKLERFLLGELPGEQRKALQDALERQPELEARIRALRKSNQELLESHPPAWMARRILTRTSQPGNPHSEKSQKQQAHRFLPSTLYALAALLIVVMPMAIFQDTPGDGTRTKGNGDRLEVFRRIPGGTEALRDGAISGKGDIVQLRWRVDQECYGAILSVDGRGQVTMHLPESAEAGAVRLSPGHMANLPHAYELDDAPLAERFFFVTAKDSFDLPQLVRRLRQELHGGTPPSRLGLPQTFSQKSFTLRKKEGT